MRLRNRYRSIVGIVLLLALNIAAGPPACDSKDQPRTVADILVAAGDAKRALREQDRQVPGTGITAQQDYDISSKLLSANRAYRAFIATELARLDAGGTANPDARRAAINALVTSLRALDNPSVLGIKSKKARETWTVAIAGLSTVITGLEVLGGSQ